MEDIEPEILKRFDLVCRVGKGCYGMVYKAYDKKAHKIVALKKIHDAFKNVTDSQRTYREVSYLYELGEHKNIIKLKYAIQAENDRDLYLIFEYLDTDLHIAIRSNILEPIHKKSILYQVVKALKYMHSADIVHRDIKPSNILMNENCAVKICDFGLVRNVTCSLKGIPPVMTESVGTLWYRSPEILLGSQKYSKESDMWSVGCLLAELLGCSPIFPGTSTINQLNKILEITGKPSKEDILSLQSEYASQMFESITSIKTKSLKSLYKHADNNELDLLNSLLQFNPFRRLTAEQALEHPYFYDICNPKKEIECTKRIKLLLPDTEKFSIKEYKQVLYNEILNRKKLDSLMKLGLKDKDFKRKKEELENEINNKSINTKSLGYLEVLNKEINANKENKIKEIKEAEHNNRLNKNNLLDKNINLNSNSVKEGSQYFISSTLNSREGKVISSETIPNTKLNSEVNIKSNEENQIFKSLNSRKSEDVMMLSENMKFTKLGK